MALQSREQTARVTPFPALTILSGSVKPALDGKKEFVLLLKCVLKEKVYLKMSNNASWEAN